MCRTLVIEDEWLIADHIAGLAEAAGASSIEFASTEAEAIAAARRVPPDIILSDVRLAEGSGPRAVEAIQNEIGPIPAIFITGNPEQVAHSLATAVLSKPIVDREFIEAFRRAAPNTVQISDTPPAGHAAL